MTARALAACAVVLTLLGVPCAAQAETFVVEDGVLHGNTFHWNWTGAVPVPRSALGGVGVTGAEMSFSLAEFDPAVLAADTRFVMTRVVHGAYSGFVNLGGGDGDVAGEGSLRFTTGPLETPASFPGAVDELGLLALSTPFSMTGFVSGTVRASGDTNDILGSFANRLTGVGTATVYLQPDTTIGQFTTIGIDAHFQPGAPVPEPSTLVLSGLAALGLCRSLVGKRVRRLRA